MKRPRRVMLIGLDAATPEVTMRLIREEKLPNLARLVENGYFADALAPLPTATSINWTTIATGATPGTHGINDMFLHEPGEPLDVLHDAFDTRKCHAEFIWDAVERGGKLPILLKYTCSWPPTIRNGAQVDGHGRPWRGASVNEICPSNCFSTEPLPFATLVEPRPAEGWRVGPEDVGTSPLEVKLVLKPIKERAWDHATGPLAYGEHHVKYHALIVKGSSGYDRVIICRDKDIDTAVADLRVGQWSPPVIGTYVDEKGQVEGATRFKLLKLSPDGRSFRLFSQEVLPTKGRFTFPESLAEELTSRFGPYLVHPNALERAFGWFDDETFLELVEYQNTWFAQATRYLLKRYEDWALYMNQVHCIDYVFHLYLAEAEPLMGRDARAREHAWRVISEVHASVDRMIGELLDVIDEETVVIVVSDHGSIGAEHYINVNEVLREAGLLEYMGDLGNGQPKIDWAKTKAFSPQSVHVYVNLKGRDPHGIVEPGAEYEEVRDRIIAALYDLKDPRTGRRKVDLALRREDARIVGLYGERCGDVVFALGSEYSHNHGQQLPTKKYGISSLAALFVMAGPGIKKGQVGKPIWLMDIAPTIAHLLDVPVPRDAEGRVIHEAFEDPDWKRKEIALLEEERNRWKAAFEQYQKVIMHT